MRRAARRRLRAGRADQAFRDFVIEANRGRSVWFVADIAELQRRLRH
ncbi:DUF4180 domain-containing protein [Methylosinus sp. Sm6]